MFLENCRKVYRQLFYLLRFIFELKVEKNSIQVKKRTLYTVRSDIRKLIRIMYHQIERLETYKQSGFFSGRYATCDFVSCNDIIIVRGKALFLAIAGRVVQLPHLARQIGNPIPASFFGDCGISLSKSPHTNIGTLSNRISDRRDRNPSTRLDRYLKSILSQFARLRVFSYVVLGGFGKFHNLQFYRFVKRKCKVHNASLKWCVAFYTSQTITSVELVRLAIFGMCKRMPSLAQLHHGK